MSKNPEIALTINTCPGCNKNRILLPYHGMSCSARCEARVEWAHKAAEAEARKAEAARESAVAAEAARAQARKARLEAEKAERQLQATKSEILETLRRKAR